MKIKDVNTYTVAFIKEKLITDDISECLIVSCGNYTQLEKITGFSINHLVYLFTKLKKKTWTENGIFIIKSEQYYKGEQIGGIRNPALYKRGNE